MASENTKDDKAKCPAFVGKPGGEKKKCDKDHRPEMSKMGDSKGSSTRLAANLGGALGHDDYDGDRTLAAHHLISCQIFTSKVKPKDNQFWEDVCHAYGYDINCKENGEFFPRKMYLACLLKKPLHRGNHDSAEVYDGEIVINTTYTKQVKNLVKPEKDNVKNGIYCNDHKKLIEAMNKISSTILTNINSFAWTLTFDGRDYMDGGIGCCNFISISVKRATEIVIGLRGKKLIDVEDQLTKNFRCNRKHNRKHKKINS